MLGIRQVRTTASEKLLQIREKGNGCVTDRDGHRYGRDDNSTAGTGVSNFRAIDIQTIFSYLAPMPQPTLLISPIGVIRTPFKTKYGAPRQPATAREKTIGVITLNDGHNFEQAIEDLTGFDYIWVLFWLHKNKNWKPKVLPPNGSRTKRGLFSTRSPHRPNPIGLSLCKLLSVKGRTVRIENPDMLDGTPVLDIKPYIPHAESHPEARGGWIRESHEQTKPAYRVLFSPDVKKVLREMNADESREISSYLNATLSRDPHPHVYRRIKILNDGTAVIAVKRWRFVFKIENTTVRVLSIARAAEKRGDA
jgi:tRNA-Thr(GGU) m(6)t(6)A37 methyltransferase TsaA